MYIKEVQQKVRNILREIDYESAYSTSYSVQKLEIIIDDLLTRLYNTNKELGERDVNY